MAVEQVLFMQEPGDTSAISMNDVNQGWLGDCNVCATIAALAMEDPDYVASIIRDNGNGTQSVRLYLGTSSLSDAPASGLPTATGNSAWITVNDSNLGAGMNTGGQLLINNVQEIWPQVIENAIAQISGGYSVLNYGGSSATIMQELTGTPAVETYISVACGLTSQPSTAQLQAELNAKDMITFFTSEPDGYGLIDDHYYTLTSVETISGVDYAYFRNPWGYDNPQPVPVSDLGNAFFGMDVGTVPQTLAGISVPQPTAAITTVTGNRGGGVTLVGTSKANSIVTVTDSVGGSTNVVGTASTSNNGAWQLVSRNPINTASINSFASTEQNAADLSSGTPGMLILASTGTDTINAMANVSEVFAIMSFHGSDIINGFQTSSAVGAAHDYLNFSGRGITSFTQVQSMMSGVSSTIINIGSGKTITLADVAPTSLTASDFRYS